MDEPIFLLFIAIPLFASPLIYFSYHFGPTAQRLGFHRWLAFLVLLATWIPFALAAHDLHNGEALEYTVYGITLRMDGLSLLLGAVALGLGTFVVLYSGAYMSKETGQDKFFAMLVAMVGVMIGLGFATDLFNLWVWFEAMAVTSYLLVAFYRDQPASLEAGLKYLMQSAAGSVLVLLGIGLVLSQTGTTDMRAIRAANVADSKILLAAGALFIIGFGVKTALVPLHTWLPDAHSQAPSGISAMLSGVVIETGLVAMLRALIALTGVTPTWGELLMGFGAANMLLGNLMALRQTQVKRLLAYSSLAHVGYMLVGIGVAAYYAQSTTVVGAQAGAQGGLFHLVNHGLMKGLAFLSAGAFLYVLHIAAGSHAPLTRDDLAGASKRYPWAALSLSIAVLGLGGIPPLAGFMSKWQIFVGGFQTKNETIQILVVFAALNSVLSLAYYAPIVNIIYRHEPSEAVKAGQPLPLTMTIPLVIMALGVIVIGLWPNLLDWLTEPAGSALLRAFAGGL